MMERSITGALLAGGKSSRMGTDKAMLELDGIPLIEHVASTMRASFDRLILINDRQAEHEFLRLPAFEDLFKNCGPLGGIHSALAHSASPWTFVAACDIPFVSRELLLHIADYPSPALVKIPVMDDHLHPLCGLYSRECLPAIVNLLESKRLRVLDLFDEVPTALVPITGSLPFYNRDLLLNFNNPADYSRFNGRLHKRF